MYLKDKTSNGIKIIGEVIPHFRSVSVGFWLGVGSSWEKPEENGVSHYIEHMLFKGTEKRTARQIAEEMDAVGGHLNAFTSRECTCYYCKVIDEHLDMAVDLIGDMIINSTFDEVEMNKEKGVILEEIAMVEDSPEDVVHEQLMIAHYGDHPLGQSISGNQAGVSGLSRETVLDFFNKNYTPANMVISIAGNFDKKNLRNLVEDKLGDMVIGDKNINFEYKPVAQADTFFKQKDIEQAHLAMSFPGLEAGNDDAYPLMVFNNLFGGSMSSRLFQHIREEMGLVYSIYSNPSLYLGSGMFSIITAMNMDNAVQVTNLIRNEIDNVLKNGFNHRELTMAREQLKGNFILGLESTSSRMNAMGRSELLLNRVLNPSEILEKIDAVTAADMRRVVGDIFNFDNMALSLVGSENKIDDIKNILI